MLPFSSALMHRLYRQRGQLWVRVLPHAHSRAPLCSLGQSSSKPRRTMLSHTLSTRARSDPTPRSNVPTAVSTTTAYPSSPLLWAPINCRPVVEGGIPPDGPLSVLPPHAWVKRNTAGKWSPAATSLRQPRPGRVPALFRLSVLHPCPYSSTSTCLDLKRCTNSAV